MASGAEPSQSATPEATSPTPQPSLLATPQPTASAEAFEFIRWTGGYKILASEPGGPVNASQDIHADQIAGVIDKVEIDGVEWIRVLYGHDRPGDWVNLGWAPSEADIDRGGGIHVDPVYEYVVPECPAEFTIGDLGSMVPTQALYCLGSQTLTVSPVRVRSEGNELDYFLDGAPEWLAIGNGLVAHWLPGYEELGAAPIYVDPTSDVQIPAETWVELTGHLDHPAAETCEMTSTEPEIRDVRNDAEAALLCRGRLVVSGVRELSDAEIPRPSGRVTPGPQPTIHVKVALRQEDIPNSIRYWSSSVWSGSQLLAWGGSDANDDGGSLTNMGFTYTPATNEFGVIPRAPLSARGTAVSTWTGSELLVWGGSNAYKSPLSDGAAYDPASRTWRAIADGPLTWSDRSGSAWTGTDWWIATDSSGGVQVAAYTPATDTWRELPTIPDEYADDPTIAWTGSEILLLTAAGLFSLAEGASEWVLELQENDLHGPAVWTGDVLLLQADSPIGDDALNFDYLTYPVAWDPETRSTVDLSLPPRNVFDPIVAGSHLLFIGQALALDLAHNEWIALDLDEPTIKALDLLGYSATWAGDRLLLWGGIMGCGEGAPKLNLMNELAPDWSHTDGSGAGASSFRYSLAPTPMRILADGALQTANFAC